MHWDATDCIFLSLSFPEAKGTRWMWLRLETGQHVLAHARGSLREIRHDQLPLLATVEDANAGSHDDSGHEHVTLPGMDSDSPRGEESDGEGDADGGTGQLEGLSLEELMAWVDRRGYGAQALGQVVRIVATEGTTTQFESFMAELRRRLRSRS